MFDWEYASILNEYEKFWKRENTSRPILNLSYSVPCKSRYRTPATLEEQWLDAEYRYAAFKHNLNASGYIAEGRLSLGTFRFCGREKGARKRDAVAASGGAYVGRAVGTNRGNLHTRQYAGGLRNRRGR